MTEDAKPAEAPAQEDPHKPEAAHKDGAHDAAPKAAEWRAKAGRILHLLMLGLGPLLAIIAIVIASLATSANNTSDILLSVLQCFDEGATEVGADEGYSNTPLASIKA